MNRRKTPLWNRHSEALTPEPRQPYGAMSHAELVEHCLDLKNLLSAERRRNAAIERILIKHCEETDARNAGLREAMFSALTLRPSQSERKAS